MFNQTQKILLALGVGAVSLLGAGQVSAQQAYISGSSTLVLMNGATQSIGAELAAPLGIAINGGVVATPTYNPGSGAANLSDNTVTFGAAAANAFTVANDGSNYAAAPAGSSFTAAAAAQLDAETTLAPVVSIIRAGAGVDGLD